MVFLDYLCKHSNSSKLNSMDKKKFTQLKPGDIAMIGVPSDENSSFMRGCAKAPEKIREVFYSDSANTCAEGEFDIMKSEKFKDIGDVENKFDVEYITGSINDVLSTGSKILAIGGDHAVTYPVFRALGKKYDKINILHFDAHPDLYDHYNGNKYSNACPFARIMEEFPNTKIQQIGIRTINPHQREQANKFGVEVIEMRNEYRSFTLSSKTPLYISLDIDALDPAFAPGVSHHEPGGMTTREILDIIQRIDVPVLGADIVEYNPTRDVVDMTAMVAAKFIKEISKKMMER